MIRRGGSEWASSGAIGWSANSPGPTRCPSSSPPTRRSSSRRRPAPDREPRPKSGIRADTGREDRGRSRLLEVEAARDPAERTAAALRPAPARQSHRYAIGRLELHAQAVTLGSDTAVPEDDLTLRGEMPEDLDAVRPAAVQLVGDLERRARRVIAPGPPMRHRIGEASIAVVMRHQHLQRR